MTLVVPANKDSIEHGLVRGYMGVVFTVMSEAKYDKEVNLFVHGAKTAGLIKLEKQLKAALLADLKNAKNVNSNLFADPVDAVIEAADQFYCSDKTRSAMKAKYPRTYNKFISGFAKTIHEEEPMPGQSLSLVEGVIDESDDGEMALFGYGWGNGPIRQARSNARASGGSGLFPAWNNARRQGYASGGRGVFPNRPKLFPGMWRR